MIGSDVDVVIDGAPLTTGVVVSADGATSSVAAPSNRHVNDGGREGGANAPTDEATMETRTAEKNFIDNI